MVFRVMQTKNEFPENEPTHLKYFCNLSSYNPRHREVFKNST